MRRTLHGTRGFSFMEIIIIVAIIVIVYAVALDLLEKKGERDRNEMRNNIIGEYIKALRLIFDDTGAYPGPVNRWTCLGDYSDDGCWDNNDRSEDPELNALMGNYLRSLPAGDTVGPYEGFLYRRCTENEVGCTPDVQNEMFEIRWFLKGTNEQCLGTLTPYNVDYNLGITQCRYLQQ